VSCLTTQPTPSASSNDNETDILGLGSNGDGNNMNLVKIAVPSVVGGVVLFLGTFMAVWWVVVRRAKKRDERRERKGKEKEKTEDTHASRQGDGVVPSVSECDYERGRYELYGASQHEGHGQDVIPIMMVGGDGNGQTWPGMGETVRVDQRGSVPPSGAGQMGQPGPAASYYGDKEHWEGGYI